MALPAPQLVQNARYFSFIPNAAIRQIFNLGDTVLLQVRVDPELALDWLTSRNTTNRKIRKSAVTRYGRDMTAHQWISELVDPIHFSVDGVNMNGQHRLTSIVESGETIVLWVQVGCKREWQVALDCGMPRSQVDVERLTYGSDVDERFIATARSMKMGLMIHGSTMTFTRQEMHDFIDRHQHAIRFATGLFPSHIVSVTTAGLKGVIARAYYSRPPATLQAFAEVLRTREVRSPHHHIVIILRNWMEDRGTGGSGIMREHYAKTSRALHAFCEEKPLMKLYAADVELFPLPGERSL